MIVTIYNPGNPIVVRAYPNRTYSIEFGETASVYVLTHAQALELEAALHDSIIGGNV